MVVEVMCCQDVGDGVVGYVCGSGGRVVGCGVGVIVGCFVVVCGCGGCWVLLLLFWDCGFMDRVVE